MSNTRAKQQSRVYIYWAVGLSVTLAVCVLMIWTAVSVSSNVAKLVNIKTDIVKSMEEIRSLTEALEDIEIIEITE